MKRRSDSYFGLHFDFHASPERATAPIGATLKEEELREICRLLKPDFLQIDCKGHPGWASYPTGCGNAMPEFRGDPLEMWRRVTKEEDVALYMHYSGVIDINYCSKNPDQVARNADGTPNKNGSTRTIGTYADDLLIPQLIELADKYGVDGAWVDGDCWGSQADFHPDTIKAFEKETGIDLKGKLPASRGDEYYDEFREYCRELFRRYVRHYVDAIHEKHPEFQIASNWFYTDHAPEAVTSNVDFLSGDLNPFNGFNSARYAGRAIAQQNHTWDLMSWNFRGSTAERPGHIPKHPLQIIQEAAAVISIGGGFQNYITQYPDGSPRMDQIRGMKAVEEFMRPREKFCFRGKAAHQVAVLLSTWDRHLESDSLFSRTGCERVMGATALTCDAGHSTEIVSEHTLKGKCADYPVIVVPELYSGLAPETVEELLAYAKNGGSLLLTGCKTCALFAEAGAPFALNEPGAPYNLFTMDGVSFGTIRNFRTISAETGTTIASASLQQRDEKSPIASIIPFGQGKIGVIGADIGLAYNEQAQYLHRTLIRAMLDGLYSPIVRLDRADGKLEITVLRKDGRMMIQLVNANGDHTNPAVASEDFIPAVYEVALTVALDKRPASLVLQPEGRKLDFEYADGKAKLYVGKVEMHDVIEVVE